MPDAQVVATSRWLRLRSGRARAGTGSAVGRPCAPAAVLTIIRACDQAANDWLAPPPIRGAPTETGPQPSGRG
jgi:hypothetical protein